jgi:hypothetical protein
LRSPNRAKGRELEHDHPLIFASHARGHGSIQASASVPEAPAYQQWIRWWAPARRSHSGIGRHGVSVVTARRRSRVKDRCLRPEPRKGVAVVSFSGDGRRQTVWLAPALASLAPEYMAPRPCGRVQLRGDVAQSSVGRRSWLAPCRQPPNVIGHFVDGRSESYQRRLVAVFSPWGST